MSKIRISRRGLLIGAGTVPLFAPAISRAADRPTITHGVQSGDVTQSSAVTWARVSQPARVKVEFATTDSFRTIIGGGFADALPESDLTMKLGLDGLPAGQDVFFRVTPQNLADPSILGETAIGHFRSAPADNRTVTFVWSGDTGGQGWGINEDWGGMKAYATMLKHDPDFFLHSGDTIYADGIIPAEVKLKDGTVWKNLTTEAKSKVAETLDDFRGNYAYNLLDRNVRAFNAQVPMLVQWDDHEVTNNWWPEEPLTRGEHQRKKYHETFVLPLVARSHRAFHEYMPVARDPLEPNRIYRRISHGPLVDVFIVDQRSYRGPNGANLQDSYGPAAHFMGPAQIAWLKRGLKASRATWKVIAADMPISIYVMYDGDTKSGSEGVAQMDHGMPRGRELEIADLLSFIKREKIANTVWLTADVHYTAAHYYDPDKAKFQDFDPFWEFVSGPIHAGTFGPGQLDQTFGPQLRYVKAPTAEQGQNTPPTAGLQFFGHVKVDGQTKQMTVTLRDVADNALWATTIDPAS
ncbi:MAG: alkaline phosphatase [Acetobacteraceae bacterium]